MLNQLQPKLNVLAKLCMENLDIIFNELKLDYKQNDKYIYMACPIHNSNNPGSLNLYLNGDGV